VNWVTRTVRFQPVKQRVTKNLPCPDCGKNVKRQTTFEQTLNPWNKNTDGDPKSAMEIHAELKVAADAWRAEPVQCKSCRESGEGGDAA
jgi:predicted RNA-binding Zn-ribbon protein involved in translation (DUF1610 family)